MKYFFIHLKNSTKPIEIHEQSEEMTTRKRPVIDENLLHPGGTFQKRFSMMHHMPSTEAIVDEDLTVRVPGGATEEIIIHTDFVPSTPRLSVEEYSMV